jgi:hypothetical protein
MNQVAVGLPFGLSHRFLVWSYGPAAHISIIQNKPLLRQGWSREICTGVVVCGPPHNALHAIRKHDLKRSFSTRVLVRLC